MNSRLRMSAYLSLFISTVIALAALPAGGQTDAAQEGMAQIRPEAIRADMRFLSDDLLEGRGTASRGYQIAARFMAEQFESMRLEPAGDAGTFFQRVPLRSMKADAKATSLTLIRNGKPETLAFGKDFLAGADPVRRETSIEAPVVFAGFGVTAPEEGYDDYKGIDAKGKIVALVFGAPNFESSLKAHYTSGEVKAANAVAHGAAGVLILDDPTLEKLYSFRHRVRDLAVPQLRWLDRQGQPNNYHPELKGNAVLNMEQTRKLFAGSRHTADEVFAAIKAGKPESFDLPVTAKIRDVSISKNVESPNIVAKLEGSDPELKNEYVVFSSHLDHLGIAAPIQGDKIYNGALDNASGSAILIELARAFSSMKTRPRRSILFLSVTGEEGGLLGSDYFAHYPTVAKKSIVADVNVDEDLMLWPVEDIIAFGAEHSSLNNVIQKAARQMGLVESPDPMPQEVAFIRSDQYSFVKQGIPAVMPSPGMKSTDPKIVPMKLFENWEATRYHHPGDDMNQPGLDFEAAAKFARFVYLCGYSIAQDQQRPTWNKGDFFGEHYGKRAQ